MRTNKERQVSILRKFFIVLFFLFSFSCLIFSESDGIIADSGANTSLPMFIYGDKLIYDGERGNITGSGNIIIKQDDIQIYADRVYVNAETGDISVEGNVLFIRADVKVQSDSLYYNTKNKSAFTRDVHVSRTPFIIRGAEMKREGKTNEIKEPVFTSCNMEKPHYRMQSSAIYIYDDDKLEAWNTVVFLGAIPVLYLPYYSQPLKTRKTPFDFRAGHSDYAGWYTYIKYNFYFDALNSGALGFDYREKIGNNYSLDYSYGFSRNSTGNFNGFYNYMKDNPVTGKDRWSLRHIHTHRFDERTSFGLNWGSISDRYLNREFFENEIDTFRQDAYAYYSTSAGNHSFTISVADTEQLNTINSRYYTVSRKLPEISYAMTSTQFLPRFYYSQAFNFSRSLNLEGAYYNNTGSFRPGLTYSLPQLSIITLTGSANMESAWKHSENNKGMGELLNTGTVNEVLVMNFIPGYLTLNTSHTLSRRFNKNSGMPHTGFTANSIASSLSAGISTLRLTSSISYDLLSDKSEVENDKDRFSMLVTSITGSYDTFYLNANTSYSVFANMIKNASFGLGISEPGKGKWNFSSNISYINNLIDANERRQLNVNDILTFSSMLSFAFTEEFRLTVTRGYDLMAKQITSETYALNWYLHCWQAYLSYGRRPVASGGYSSDLYFSIFITDIPEFKLNKPSSSDPNQNLLFGQLLQQQ